MKRRALVYFITTIAFIYSLIGSLVLTIFRGIFRGVLESYSLEWVWTLILFVISALYLTYKINKLIKNRKKKDG